MSLAEGAVRSLVARFAAPEGPPPSLGIVGVGGSGMTTLLDAVVHARDAAGLRSVRLAGYRLEAEHPLGALDHLGADDEGGARRRLAELVGPDGQGLVVVDDAQWLDPASLRVVVGLVEWGVAVLAAHRPHRSNQALAVLDGALSRREPVVSLPPLAGDDLAGCIAAILDAPPDEALLTAVAALTGGRRLLVERLLRGWRDEGLLARGRLQAPAPGHLPYLFLESLRGRLGQMPTEERQLVLALANGGDAAEPVLADAAARARPEVFAEVEGSGLAIVGLGPALAGLVSPAERAGAEALVAELLARLGRPAREVANHLRQAHATGPTAAATYVAAGDADLSDDPDAAVAWYELALQVDQDLAPAASGLAQALAWAGEGPAALEAAETARRRATADAGRGPGAASAADAVVAAVLAGRGLWRDAAHALVAVAGHPAVPDPFFAWQAVVCAVIGGDVGGALGIADAVHRHEEKSGPASPPPVAVMAVARAAKALLSSIGPSAKAAREAVDDLDEPGGLAAPAGGRPHQGRPAPERPGDARQPGHRPAGSWPTWVGARPTEAYREMLEAATLAGPAAAPCPPAISVHEVAITMALAVGDVATARALAAEAPPTALRGAAVELAARWAATRAGDTATNPPGASGLVALAVDAASARRASDVATATSLAKRAAAEVGAAGVDLLNLDACGELGILLQRYGYPQEAADLEQRVEALFERLGRPLMWGARLAWAGLEAAVATRRPEALAVHARVLAEAAEAMGRLSPLARAANIWSSVLTGDVRPAELEEVVNALKEGGFVWEAAQLAGQAAIRVDDAALAKSLLGRARSLRQASGGEEEGAVTPAGLSEREREVGRLVLDGLTHKDIGATLYISPKTVEHHVAHIRQKLGSSSRAEFLAALRVDLEAVGA